MRTFISIAVIAALALLLALAASAPGEALIDWFGWSISFHPAWLLIGIIAALALQYAIRRFWTWLRWRSGLFGPERTLRRQRRARGDAFAALGALVSGQDARARTLAGEALRRDPSNDLARGIAALTGDADERARLAADPATRPLAALAQLRSAPTLASAEEAVVDASANPAAWRALTEMRARAGDFSGAEKALSSWRAIDDEADAAASWVLASLKTAAADTASDDAAARRLLHEALKEQPRFAPAAARLAERASAGEDVRDAERAALRTWRVQPTPRLARAYAALEPLETDEAALARAQKLAGENPGHVESALAVARAALPAGEASLALETLGPHLRQPPVRQEAAALALEAHRRLGMDPPAGAPWLSAAATGRLAPPWRCTACRTAHDDWRLDCDFCGRIGSLRPEGGTQRRAQEGA